MQVGCDVWARPEVFLLCPVFPGERSYFKRLRATGGAPKPREGREQPSLSSPAAHHQQTGFALVRTIRLEEVKMG